MIPCLYVWICSHNFGWLDNGLSVLLSLQKFFWLGLGIWRWRSQQDIQFLNENLNLILGKKTERSIKMEI